MSDTVISFEKLGKHYTLTHKNDWSSRICNMISKVYFPLAIIALPKALFPAGRKRPLPAWPEVVATETAFHAN
jgi:hypothetical protein